MKKLICYLLIFFLSNNSLSYSIENERNLKNEISKNIRCLICQGQSIYDSQSDFAISMKIVIEKKNNWRINRRWDIWLFEKSVWTMDSLWPRA